MLNNKCSHRIFKSLYVVIILLITEDISAQTEIGLQVFTYDQQFRKDVPGTLDKIKQMGFRELEAGDTYGMSFTDFKNLLDKDGFKVISFGTDFGKLERNPDSVANDAEAWGAKYVTCFWIPHHENDFTIEDIKKAVEVFNTAGKVLRKKGLYLCYHPHGFEFRPYETGTLFDYLINHTKNFLNFEMDVYWIKNSGQEPIALLKKYPGRFPLMHLKDRKLGTIGNQNGNSDKESNVVLGSGDVGIADIMAEAKKAGVKYYFIEDESSRSEQQVPESLAYLKTLK
ncbi:MAG TPA: sugar phosphate isomerase/epimerase [Puia sp.]|nr:sugar phosphate isomerase/epimerase [Puia sp.]